MQVDTYSKCTKRHVHSERRVIVLTAVVATEILVFAEVVALSFIIQI